MSTTPAGQGASFTDEPAALSVVGWLALVVALAASVGSIYLSTGMGLIACPLCFYQRSFALGVAAVLLMGLLTDAGTKVNVATFALPLALAGTAVAGFHVRLEMTGTLECPKGVGSLGTAPQQSLAGLGLLSLLLLLATLIDSRPGGGISGLVGAIVLGGCLAAGCIVSAPKLPDPPTEPYKTPLKVCRPPYVAT